MEHLPTDSEFEIMKDIDFIVPLKQVTNNVIQTTSTSTTSTTSTTTTTTTTTTTVHIITNIINIGWCNNKSCT